MAQDFTPWVEHLSGLIFLADPAWHRPSGKQADMADTFRRLGRAYQARKHELSIIVAERNEK